MLQEFGDKLEKIQNSLKKERVIETLTANRLKVLNQQLCDTLDDILPKRKLYLYMLGYYKHLYSGKIIPSFFSSLFNDQKTLLPTKANANRSIMNTVIHFRKNISIFSRVVDHLVKRSKESILPLTFSTIPALFGLFAFDSDQWLYLEFLEQLYKESKETCILIARSLFLIPEFRSYLLEILNHISVQFCKIQGTQLAEQFLNEFLDGAKKYIHLCPSIFFRLAEKRFAPDIFYKSFFEEIINYPILYGVIQIGEAENISDAVTILLLKTIELNPQFIPDLVAIFTSDNTEQDNNPYSAACELVSAYQDTYYFTPFDIQMLQIFNKLQENTKFTEPFPNEYETEYSVFIYQNSFPIYDVNNPFSHSSSSKNGILISAENALRSILTTADPIPKLDDYQLSKFLKMNFLDQTPTHLSIQQSANFSVLKACRKRYEHDLGRKVSLADFINTLIPNLRSQKRETALACSDKLQNYTSAEIQLRPNKKRISTQLNELKFALQYIAISTCFGELKISIDESAFLTKTGLLRHYSLIQTTWDDFAKKNLFTIKNPKEMLLIEMTKGYKYDNMILVDKKLTALDKLFQDIVPADNGSFSDNEKLDNLLKNQGYRFQSAIDLLKKGYAVDSILLSMKLLTASVNCALTILSEEFKAPGMEELTPTLYYMVTVTKPPKFISKTEYLFRVFGCISEFSIEQYRQFQINLFYLHQTAVFCFHSQNPNPLDESFVST